LRHQPRPNFSHGDAPLLRPQRADFVQVVRGFLMGSADIIPGVSGGTIALILGIYTRLVTAISRFDAQLLRLVAQREWRAAAAHVDLRFLVALGVGILSGIVCLASLVLYLLTEQRSYTLAVFFGLILASSLIVARMVRPRTSGQLWGSLLLALAATLFAFWLVGLQQFGSHDSLVYYFFCGTVAICAMILPGISGAYILWLLGAYETVAGIIHNLTSFDVTTGDLLKLAVFAAGCAVGLVTFSKLLRLLLDRAHMATMAVLGGFMVGSLRLMWPFQTDVTPEIEKLKLKQFEPYMPSEWTSEVTACLVLGIVALVAILALEHWGSSAGSEEEAPAMP
jgi:putative membrane protein